MDIKQFLEDETDSGMVSCFFGERIDSFGKETLVLLVNYLIKENKKLESDYADTSNARMLEFFDNARKRIA